MSRLSVQGLFLEQITNFFQDISFFEAKLDCFREAEASLLESLLAELEAQHRVKSPHNWVRVIDDVGLGESVFRPSELPKSQQTKTKMNPGISAHILLAHLEEDSLGVLPGLSLRVNEAESLLKHVVSWSGLDPQGVDVGLFAVEQVALQEESVASQDPSLLVVAVSSEELVESSGGVRVACLKHSDLSEGHQEFDR